VTNYRPGEGTQLPGNQNDAPTVETSSSPKKPRRASVQLFDPKEGLKALAAAKEVVRLGPLRWGMDGRFWAYDRGVWAPGEDELHGRIVRVLADRYRPAHNNAIRDVTRAIIDPIDCSPVPEFINFRNGLLRWRTGELIPHDPSVPTTVQLTIDWQPTAQCGLFHEFLSQVVAEDDRPRVWEVIGYMLMSGNPLHRAFLLAGGGRNGKSAFMRTVLAILGKANVSHVPLADFSANRFATAQLYGRMANVCGDIDSTYLENTGRFKEAVGEDELQAEHKFGQPFRFTAWCSMLFSANEIPGSADSSKGWVDRWEVIPFPNYIGDRVDKTLEPRLQAQESLQGIAAAAVAALRVLMDRQSFRVTAAGSAAKEEFARKSNALYQWLDDRCTVTGATEDFEKSPVLYEDYRKWAEETGLKTLSRPKFYEKLRQVSDRGITGTKRNGIDGFKGVKLGRIS
jgi:putative DNA primase/helicase